MSGATTKRNWAEARRRAQVESQQLEELMRSILKLFADGCLVYRDREQRTQPVSTQSARLKRIRSGLVSRPLDPSFDGPAAVA